MSLSWRLLTVVGLPLAMLLPATAAAAPPAAPPALAPAPDPAQIHQVTDQVLRQGKYRLQPNPVQQWLERALAALVRRLGDWLGRIGESALLAAGAEIIFYTLTALVLSGALFLLTRLVLGRWRTRGSSGPAGPVQPAHAPSLGDLQAQAAALAARGEYGSALRLLQQACLLALDRRGLLAVRSSSTDGEYLRQLRFHPAPRAWLAELAALVELYLYGGRPLDKAQYHHGETAARALLTGSGVE